METVKNWLVQAKNYIDALDAEVIALKVFAPKGADRSWLIAHDDVILRPEQILMANDMVADREEGMPLAYILTEKEFYGRKFWVDENVLIPRPETEDLIELVKTLDLPAQARFLELGTGSGCVAITLALEFPQAYVLATDVSEEALEVAERNDEAHEGRIELMRADLVDGIDLSLVNENRLNLEGREQIFDVLIANLPYVDRKWEWLDRKSLSFEPSLALFAKENGLGIYHKMLKQLEKRSNLARYVVLEADPCQHPSLIALAEKHGLKHLETRGFGLVFRVS